MKDLTELGLRHPAGETGLPPGTPLAPPTTSATSAADLIAFVERLLDVMATLAPETSADEQQELAAHIADYRDQVNSVRHAQEVRSLAASIFKTCERFLKSSKAYFASKDQEVLELMTILRTAAESSLGSSDHFSTEVLSSMDRFRQLGQLDDIRDLKRRLTTEVSSLQKATEEKQKRDAAALADLRKRVEELQINLIKAEEEAALDELTQVANRRSFDRALKHAILTAHKKNEPLALAIVDIDHFKAVNDSYGHAVGDRVLRCAADLLASAVRRDDVVARYGGEEFAIILTGGELAGAERRMTELLKKVATQEYEYEAGDPPKKLRFTVSCGLAQLASKDGEQDLIERADAALYDAKRQGRNRVVSRRKSRLGQLFS